jgi:hypothetical protein
MFESPPKCTIYRSYLETETTVAGLGGVEVEKLERLLYANRYTSKEET